MAIQPTPPIQLDPSMDTGHQLAFINQNFNNIASVIGQNSFVIINSGTTSITGINGVKTVVVTHNLGYTPAVLAFADFSGSFTPLPRIVTQGGATLTMNSLVRISFISTTELWVEYTNGSVSPEIGFTVNVKYYLLQQTAN